METPPAETRCNRCQTPIPVDAPVPFCPPCIAAGALRQSPEGPGKDDSNGPNWPAIGLALAVLGVMAFLIFESAFLPAPAGTSPTTNAVPGTNPPTAPNPPSQ
jgi:hypothetical protein